MRESIDVPGPLGAFQMIEEGGAFLAFLAVCFFAVVMHPVLA